MPVSTREGATLAAIPIPLLAREKVRFTGEPVAAVVAETRACAEDARALIAVDYDPLPALLEPRQAAGAGVVLHDGVDDNVLLRWSRSAGDVAGLFRSAGVKTVRGRFHIPRLVAAPLETRGCVAAYDADSDFLTLWCSAQDPHRPLRELETVLRRPAGRSRVLVPDVGGAFGSKGTLAPEHAVTALAAIRAGRPIMWVEDRSENFLASYQGRGLDADAELALGVDGRFLALRAHLISDLGAYLYPVAAVSPACTAMMLTGPYDIPAASVEVVGIATNKVPTGPYRGAGRPEAAFVIERLADMAARSLGMDPAEIRRRNLIRYDAFPYRNALGYTYDSGDYARALSRVQERLPYRDWRARQAAGRAEGRLIGIGLAAFVDRSGPGGGGQGTGETGRGLRPRGEPPGPGLGSRPLARGRVARVRDDACPGRPGGRGPAPPAAGRCPDPGGHQPVLPSRPGLPVRRLRGCRGGGPGDRDGETTMRRDGG